MGQDSLDQNKAINLPGNVSGAFQGRDEKKSGKNSVRHALLMQDWGPAGPFEGAGLDADVADSCTQASLALLERRHRSSLLRRSLCLTPGWQWSIFESASTSSLSLHVMCQCTA